MSPDLTPTYPATRAQSAWAWLLIGLVLALGFLSVSPDTHAHLHGGDSSQAHNHAKGHDDSACAITLFQHGITMPLELPRLAGPLIAWQIATLHCGPSPLLSTTPHRLLPARGPPAVCS